MASTGQRLSQLPHPVHVSRLAEAFLFSPTRIDSVGQTFSHVLHPVQMAGSTTACVVTIRNSLTSSQVSCDAGISMLPRARCRTRNARAVKTLAMHSVQGMRRVYEYAQRMP
jgi:hypothetical protein